MLNIDTEILLKLPNKTSKDSLYTAKIVQIHEGIYTAILKQRDAIVANGVEVLLYYELDREFMQQTARIETAVVQDDITTIGFRTTGKPVSGERRQCFRVPTLIADLKVKFAGERDCPLVNISATGLGIISENKLYEGYVGAIALYFEDRIYSGEARVQSVRDLEDGRFRYGLLGIESRKGGNILQRGMQKISMAVQREQLRRQSAVR